MKVKEGKAESNGWSPAFTGDRSKKSDFKHQYVYKMIDESKAAGLTQLSVYCPEKETSELCLIHINYGGWSVQDESAGMYLEKLCERKGYAYIQLAGVGKEDGDLRDIVKSVRKGIAYIQNKYYFSKTILVGGSAGGHISLVTAFADSRPDMYGDIAITIDGVIALYTPVDLTYQYRYFVEQYKAKDIFGKIGDALYCKLFQGTSGTLGGETAKIQEAFLGKYSSDNGLYQIAKVENLIQNQKIPILFIQGEKDGQIGLEDKCELYDFLNNKTLPYTVLNLPGVDHAFDMVLPEWTIAGKKNIREIRKWIERVV